MPAASIAETAWFQRRRNCGYVSSADLRNGAVQRGKGEIRPWQACTACSSRSLAGRVQASPDFPRAPAITRRSAPWGVLPPGSRRPPAESCGPARPPASSRHRQRASARFDHSLHRVRRRFQAPRRHLRHAEVRCVRPRDRLHAALRAGARRSMRRAVAKWARPTHDAVESSGSRRPPQARRPGLRPRREAAAEALPADAPRLLCQHQRQIHQFVVLPLQSGTLGFQLPAAKITAPLAGPLQCVGPAT